MLTAKCYCEAIVRQVDIKTGKIVSESGPFHNLLMTAGLQSLAKSADTSNPATITTACRVGSGSTADKISSGAITFTQAGTTITASGGFFTAGMVGYIFKWGTGSGGNEVYITAFSSSTSVTVGTSATVGTPAVATVWNVTRTALETLLYTNTSFEVTAGSCQSTVSGAAVTHKRTYNFATQVGSYNVNEIGYNVSGTGTLIKGRIVLSSTEVVAPTNFLQVVLNFVVTYSPAAPTAVANVGTNINTAGNAMLEALIVNASNSNVAYVLSTGSSQSPSSSSIDGSGNAQIFGLIASYSQNGAPSTTTPPNITAIQFAIGVAWTYGGSTGLVTVTANTTISTAGQTLYGVCLYNGTGTPGINFDVKFTATYALPTGSFLPRTVFALQYTASLTN